jgi:hypothetical protein
VNVILAEGGESAERLELLKRGPALGGRRGSHRKEVANIKQNLEHQLIPDVRRVEFVDPVLIAGGAGAFESFAIERFKIAENSFA